jgi:hypothetical protein
MVMTSNITAFPTNAHTGGSVDARSQKRYSELRADRNPALARWLAR